MFAAPVPGGVLGGWRAGTGPRVLLLHGGPGLDFGYMDELAEELGDRFELAAYQQRGLAPSTTEGPFEVAREVADAVAVLDALDWDRAWVVGHSWGGHLLLHLMVAAPQRLQGGLAIDPLGGVGDGGVAIFEARILARTPEEDRRRAEELDARAMAGEGTAEESMESMRLVWPAYFASPDNVPPFPQFADSIPAYSGNWASAEGGAAPPGGRASRGHDPLRVRGRAREPDAHRARRRADRSCDPGRLARSRRRRRAPPLVRTPWLRPPGPAAPDRGSVNSPSSP